MRYTEKNKWIPEPLYRGSHIHFYFLLATPEIAVSATSKQGVPSAVERKKWSELHFFSVGCVKASKAFR